MSLPGVVLSPLLRHAADRVRLRGLVLTHLIGFSIFFYLFADRIWLGKLPYTSLIDLPIRLIAIWMILDRRGRLGRVRLSTWDWLNLGFVIAYGLALVLADVFLVRNVGFMGYVGWALEIAGPYLLFVIVREASLRRGFKLEVLLGWALAAFGIAAMLGLTQAANVLGMRQISATLYNWVIFDMRILGPSAEWQARGPMPHANSMAFLMALGLALVPMMFRFPSLKPWAIGAAPFMVAATFATYSRMGALAILALMAGMVVFSIIRSNGRAATAWGLSLATVLILGVSVIYAFDVKRFRAVIEGEGMVRNVKEEFGGWRMRSEGMQKALALGAEHPVFGLGATGAGTNRPDLVVRNAYSFSTVLTGLYGYVFVQYGFVGLMYITGSLLFFLWFVGRRDVPEGVAASAVAVGIVTAMFGISENSLFLSYVAGIIHLAAALALISVRKAPARRLA